MAHKFYMLAADDSHFSGWTGAVGAYGVPVPTRRMTDHNTPMRTFAQSPVPLSFSVRLRMTSVSGSWSNAFTLMELCASDGTVLYSLYYDGSQYRWKQRRDGTLFNIGDPFDYNVYNSQNRQGTEGWTLTVVASTGMTAIEIFEGVTRLSTETTYGAIIGGEIAYANFYSESHADYYVSSLLISEESAQQYKIVRKGIPPNGWYSEFDADFTFSFSVTPTISSDNFVPNFYRPLADPHDDPVYVNAYAYTCAGIVRNAENSPFTDVSIKQIGDSFQEKLYQLDGNNPKSFQSDFIYNDRKFLEPVGKNGYGFHSFEVTFT